MSYLQLLRLAAPDAVLVVTALLVLTLGLTNKGSRRLSSALAAIGILCAGGAVLTLPVASDSFHGMLVVSRLNSLFELVCLLLAFFGVLLAHSEMPSSNYPEYLAILLLATLGLLLLVSSEELLMIFIGLELSGLSLYVLTAFASRNVFGVEAGLKYFLFGSTASAFTLFGLSLIYGFCGSTALAGIASALAMRSLPVLLYAGILMTLVGFAFKVAAAPFHLWAPDTYQAAPVSSAAYIASASKVASFVVLGKILLLAFASKAGSAAWHGFVAGWVPLIALLAALSILIGNLVALAQRNVRRLLAYSAVAHGGYTLLGLVAGGRAGFSATLFYTTSYAVTLLGAFAVVGLVRRENGGDDFAHFAGLRARHPFAAGCMIVFLLSLAGLPPLPGFFGKFYLFSVTLHSGANHGLLWLVVIALLGSLISLYYYLLILKAIFFGQPSLSTPHAEPQVFRSVTLAILAAAVLFLGLWPTLLVDSILQALP